MTSSSGPLAVRRVGIIGLGLVGGSIARALRALSNPPEIAASSLDAEELQHAVDEGVVQRAGTPERVASTCEFLIYATPPRVTLELLSAHAPRWREDAVITDVASVKRPVLARARELGLAWRFVGSHPMAGNEKAGFSAARADLFAGARVWLTPLGSEGESAARTAEGVWRAMGAHPMRISAEKHDRLVAWTSHLPQLAASALASALAASGYSAEALGPGGRDATRLAASPAALWEEILLANADMLEDPLLALEGALGKLVEAVRSGDAAAIREIFENGAAWRRA
ncbi:MAG TPA: prephenate dehydrogenase/arogenate dehydrogenase family protein [Longimicrobiales bacterium]